LPPPPRALRLAAVNRVSDAGREAGDRIVLLVSLVFTGAALSAVTQLPGRRVAVEVLGSPLGVEVSGRWVVAILLLLLCVAGVDGLVRTAPNLARLPVRYTATFWVLPALVTLAAVVAIPRQLGHPVGWLAVIGLLAALFGAVVASEYATALGEGPFHRAARLILNVATYGAAFALYASIYGLQQRGLLSGPTVAAVTFPLAVELLRGTAEQLETTGLYALVVALLVAQLAVPLNWLGLSALGGGATLLLMFYAFGGISQQHLAGRLNRGVVLEYAAVVVVGLAAVAMTG